ncbi:hypothetical protein B0H17DRAFT_1151405 [Mycena rosella]|uniref:Uncharacterized protein n=1 Tax=Mycena rosella TaxID=1033263 RepID=A0AAD7BKS2_MYCRO|nr:hypothetical protein B0H17DRAFT_1151405 [Mycena rosella]
MATSNTTDIFWALSTNVKATSEALAFWLGFGLGNHEAGPKFWLGLGSGTKAKKPWLFGLRPKPKHHYSPRCSESRSVPPTKFACRFDTPIKIFRGNKFSHTALIQPVLQLPRQRPGDSIRKDSCGLANI